MVAKGGFYGNIFSSAVGNQLLCNSFQTVDQVNPSIPIPKTKENFVGCVEILHEKIVFFLQIGVYLPGSSVVLAAGSELFVSC
jgi:hypothetical protein